MEGLTLRGGVIVDPASSRMQRGDVLVAQGRIAGIYPPGEAPSLEQTIEADGLIIAPGGVDLHVHLREPGQTHKETIASGTRAAVAGGFTTICCMPNTEPPLDRPERVRAVYEAVRRQAMCRVYVIGAACLDNDSERLSDFAALKAAGCVAVTDDAFPLQEQRRRRRVLEAAAAAGLPFVAHCENKALSGGAPVHLGAVSQKLGIAGQPAEAESEAARQWLELGEIGARLHLAHISTAETIEAVRVAKAHWGARLTTETAPHYFALTEEAVLLHGANAKMNPPLRSEQDRQAVAQALADGLIEIIATDHAPHAPEEKALGLEQAPFGVIGLETALAVTLTALPEQMSLIDRLRCLTAAPAAAFGLPAGALAIGAPADLVLIDAGATWTVRPESFYSQARNTPFAGQSLRGRVWATIVNGKIVYQDGRIIS